MKQPERQRPVFIFIKDTCMQCRNLIVASIVSASITLSGCCAVGTAIKKRNLDVKTK
jgi:hypothetical protein